MAGNFLALKVGKRERIARTVVNSESAPACIQYSKSITKPPYPPPTSTPNTPQTNQTYSCSGLRLFVSDPR